MAIYTCGNLYARLEWNDKTDERQMKLRREQYRARRDTETSEERRQRLAQHYHVVKGHHNFVKALKSVSELLTQVGAVAKGSQMKPS